VTELTSATDRSEASGLADRGPDELIEYAKTRQTSPRGRFNFACYYATASQKAKASGDDDKADRDGMKAIQELQEALEGKDPALLQAARQDGSLQWLRENTTTKDDFEKLVQDRGGPTGIRKELEDVLHRAEQALKQLAGP
jgi:hypothetical protein